MKTAVVILAAGLSTRMKSQRPKVLHDILGRPMIDHVLGAVRPLRPDRILAVVNPIHHDVHSHLKEVGIETVMQVKPLGTGDAVKRAMTKLRSFRGTILVVNGDAPLMMTGTLKKFLSRHGRVKSDISVLSFRAENPFSYGRVIRDAAGNALKIVEEKNLDPSQKDIREVNSGVYALNAEMGALAGKVSKDRVKGEYYLTDVLELGVKAGHRCRVFHSGAEEDFLGVNTMADMFHAQRILQGRIVDRHMKAGVRFYDPRSVIVHNDVKIGADTVIYPNVYIEGRTVVGKRCTLFPGTRIVESTIGSDVSIYDNTVIEKARLSDNAVLGPFSRIRPETVVGRNVKIGNFVEVKKSQIGDNTKMSHLSYIGDAVIGKDVNIGAGTITCNYNGVSKHRTVIEDGVFIGSDTQLIAPVRIGKNSFVAAGSTITEDVSRGALAICRNRQHELQGWVKKKMKGRKK